MEQEYTIANPETEDESSLSENALTERAFEDIQPQTIQMIPIQQSQVQMHVQGTEHQQIKSKVTCQHCEFTFQRNVREPYLLSCGHTMCDDCIGQEYFDAILFIPQCRVFDCRAPIGMGPLKKNQQVEDLLQKGNADYQLFSKQIDVLYQSQSQPQSSSQQNGGNIIIETEEDQPNSDRIEEETAQKMLMSAFSFGDICTALLKAAKLLTKRHPDQAIKYYWQRINKIKLDVIQNCVDNKNASIGQDLFAIGSILQSNNQNVEALRVFKQAIKSFSQSDNECYNYSDHYIPEELKAQMCEGMAVIDHVLTWIQVLIQAQSHSQSKTNEEVTITAQEIDNLQQWKPLFLLKLHHLKSQNF